MTYLSRAFWSSLGSKASGTHVYRGYGAAVAASGKDKSGATSRRGSNASQRSNKEGTPKHHSRDLSAEAIVQNASKSLGQVSKDMLGTDVTEKRSRGDHEVAMEEEVAPVVCLPTKSKTRADRL